MKRKSNIYTVIARDTKTKTAFDMAQSIWDIVARCFGIYGRPSARIMPYQNVYKVEFYATPDEYEFFRVSYELFLKQEAKYL